MLSSQFSIVIQARMNSKRLSGKMALPFFRGKSILELLLERLHLFFEPTQIILATTTSEMDKGLVELANEKGIRHYRGSEANVLKRFVQTADEFGLDKIIRICADNPFLQVNLVKDLALEFTKEENDADYQSWWISDRPSIRTHSGFFAEAVSTAALKKIMAKTHDSFFLEHVTNYIYTNQREFSIKWIENGDPFLKSVRLTVDTPKDFEIAQKVYLNCEGDLGIENLKRVIYTYPEILEYMAKTIELNEK